MTVTLETKNPTCSDLSDGQIKPVVSGGTPPYTYKWASGQVTETLTKLGPGNFSLTVTDAKGCQAQAQGTLSLPTVLEVKLSATPPSCFGGKNGSITSQITGGSAPYTYQWSTGAAIAELKNVGAGAFELTVTDANGCTVKQSTTLNEPEEPKISITGDPVVCQGDSLEVIGPKGFASYKWSNGATGRSIFAKTAGVLSLTATTDDGCEVKLSTPALKIKSLPARPSVTFNGEFLQTTQAEGYQWYTNGVFQPGATGQRFVPSEAGQYTVVIKNADGCSVSSQPYQYTPPAPIPDLQVTIYPNPNRGAFNIDMKNVTDPLSITMTDAKGNQVLNESVPGNVEALVKSVDLTNPTPGLYLLKIRTSQGELSNIIRIQ
jgi:hypothetical protein